MAYKKVKNDGTPALKSAQKKMPEFKDFVLICNDYLKACTDTKKVPLLQELALLLGVERETLWKYRQKSPYGNVIKRIDEMTEIALLNKGISENKPVFTMFLLKSKYGYVEQQYQKVDLNVHGQLGVIQMPGKKPKVSGN